MEMDKQIVSNEITGNDNDVYTNPGCTPPTPLSKNQIKKKNKMAKYLEQRKLQRIMEKEKRKLKRQRQEATIKDSTIQNKPSRKEIKRHLLKEQCNICIAIDLDCDNMMKDRDLAKCVKQCLRIYTINRKSERPISLHFTGLKTDGNIHNVLKKNNGWENWQVKYHFDKTHLQLFDKDRIIYLTSESDTILEDVNENHVYVIGGLVDHNHYKSYSYDRALQSGLRTARLPLEKYVDMKTRAVLSTYHVFEILLRVVEKKSWLDAILQTIPARKGAVPKSSNDDKDVNKDNHQ